MITTIVIAAGYVASVALTRDAAGTATRALLGRGRTHAAL
jgi:hypothetical protein